LNSPVALLQGSFSVDSAARIQGMNTRLYTYKGADHVPFVGLTDVNMAYMDTTLTFVSNYLYRFVSGIIPAGINDVKNLNTLNIYPNPATAYITVEGARFGSNLNLYNITGQLVLTSTLASNQAIIHVAHLPKGVYYLIVEEKGERVHQHKIVLD
jgi:hypothetical protein